MLCFHTDPSGGSRSIKHVNDVTLKGDSTNFTSSSVFTSCIKPFVTSEEAACDLINVLL